MSLFTIFSMQNPTTAIYNPPETADARIEKLSADMLKLEARFKTCEIIQNGISNYFSVIIVTSLVASPLPILGLQIAGVAITLGAFVLSGGVFLYSAYLQKQHESLRQEHQALKQDNKAPLSSSMPFPATARCATNAFMASYAVNYFMPGFNILGTVLNGIGLAASAAFIGSLALSRGTSPSNTISIA